MFAFVTFINDQPEFIQTSKGKVYTYSSEKEARSYFDCVRHNASLYHLEPDLSEATLVDAGDMLDQPESFEPTEDQKLSLFNSYVYPSLLFWKPIRVDVAPQVA